MRFAVQLDGSRYISPTGSSPDQDFLVIMDHSGLMSDVSDDGTSKVEGLKHAMESFVRKLFSSGQHRMATVGFGTSSKVLTGFTTRRDLVVAAVNALQPIGGTYMQSAFQTAFALLQNRPEQRPCTIIVMTDGIPHDGAGLESLLEAKMLKTPGTVLHTIGFGSTKANNLDFETMMMLSKVGGGQYLFSGDSAGLEETFSAFERGSAPIADQIVVRVVPQLGWSVAEIYPDRPPTTASAIIKTGPEHSPIWEVSMKSLSTAFPTHQFEVSMLYNGGGGVPPSASGHAAGVEVIYKSSTQPYIQKTQARAPFGDEELNTKTLPVEILCRNDVMRMVDDGQDATVRAAECEGLDFVVPDATASTDFRRSCLVKPRRAVSGSKTNLKPQKTKDVFATVVPKDHSYPTSIRKSYYMPQDNQTELLMRVLASATATLSSSNLIGEFLISGIPAAPVGDIEVDVSFAIDISGVLDVRRSLAAQPMRTSPSMSTTRTAALGPI